MEAPARARSASPLPPPAVPGPLPVCILSTIAHPSTSLSLPALRNRIDVIHSPTTLCPSARSTSPLHPIRLIFLPASNPLSLRNASCQMLQPQSSIFRRGSASLDPCVQKLSSLPTTPYLNTSSQGKAREALLLLYASTSLLVRAVKTSPLKKATFSCGLRSHMFSCTLASVVKTFQSVQELSIKYTSTWVFCQLGFKL